MWPDQVSNPESLTYESGALPTALRGPAVIYDNLIEIKIVFSFGTEMRTYALARLCS